MSVSTRAKLLKFQPETKNVFHFLFNVGQVISTYLGILGRRADLVKQLDAALKFHCTVLPAGGTKSQRSCSKTSHCLVKAMSLAVWFYSG